MSWTFFTNHAHVLFCLAEDPDVRVRDISDRVGITERAVQRILSELVDDGYISATREGRRNHYEVRCTAKLRHNVEGGHNVGELLDMLGVPRAQR